ncbi:MAG: hypothetical protein V4619_00550 [Bacteroidota bacterium]
MKKTYLNYFRGISHRTFAYIFLTVISASVLLYSCRKIDAIPNNTKPLIDQAAVITKKDLIKWYNELPVGDVNNLNAVDGLKKSTGKLPFTIDWSKSVQKIINGKHVVKTPVGTNALIVFEKQGKDGHLDSYIYKWKNNKNKGREYTGDIVRFSFQDLSLKVQRFEKNKLIRIYNIPMAGINSSTISEARKIYNTQKTNLQPQSNNLKANSILGEILTAVVEAVKAVGCIITNHPAEMGSGDMFSDDPFEYIKGTCGDEKLLRIDFSAMVGAPPTSNDINGTIYGAGGFLMIGGSFTDMGGSSGGNDPGSTSGSGSSGGGGSSNSWNNISDLFWTKFTEMYGGSYGVDSPGYSTPGPPAVLVSQSQVNTALANLDVLTVDEKAWVTANISNNWGSSIVLAGQGSLSHYDKMMIKKHIGFMSTAAQLEYAKVVNGYYYHSNQGTTPPYMWWQNPGYFDTSDDIASHEARNWLEVLNLPVAGDVFTDSNGNTVSYNTLTTFFTTNPAAIEHLALGEFDQVPWPYDMATMSFETFITANNNHNVLKLQHPDWPEYRLWSTAIYQALSGKVHFALDLAGMVPGEGTAANFINGAIYYVEGDHINASISGISMVPFVSWVNKGGKWVKLAVTRTSMPIIDMAIKQGRVAIVSGKNVRFIKVAVEAFDYASVKALQAVKPADLTLRNLSSSLIDQFGHRIKPIATALKNQIDDIALHGDAAGTKTEALAHDFFEAEGYVKYNAQFGAGQGFDGVYIKGSLSNPTDIIINEAKQMSSYGNIQLNGANSNTALAAQMSDSWVDSRITAMINHSTDQSLRNLGNSLYQHRQSITKTVTAVDKARKEFVVLKLSAY